MQRLAASTLAFALLLAIAVPALAQELSFDDVLGLKELGYSDEDIVAELERSGTRLALTAAQAQKLRAAGAGERLLARLGGEPERRPVDPPPARVERLDVADPQGSAESQAYVQKIQDVGNVGIWEAIERYEDIIYCAEVHRAPGWALVSARFFLAANLLHAGQIERGLSELERAAAQGYAEYVDWHRMIPRALWDHPRVRRAYEGLRLSSADDHEMNWLLRETSATWADTNSMITGNINRKDEDYTQIAQTRVPTRATRSPIVIGRREYLRYAQASQRSGVMASDQSRIMHLTNLRVIDNINGPSQSEYERRLEVEQSRRIAQSAYEQRAASVASREFSLPAGASDEPQALPALGSLRIDGIPESREMPKTIERPAEPAADGTNYMGSLRTGDRWIYRREISFEGVDEPTVQRVTEQVSSASGGRVAFRIAYEGGGSSGSEDTATRVKSTLREQLIWDLSRQGRLRVLDYASEESTREYQGMRIPVRRVKMRYAWTLSGEETEWSAVFVVSKDERVRGSLEGTLETQGRRIVFTLEKFTPGR